LNSRVNTLERKAAGDSPNRAAREQAFQAAGSVPIEATSRVSYRSQGRLLIIGEPDQALAIGGVLKDSLHCHVLAQGEGITGAQGDFPVLFIGQGADVRIAGHLGDFAVILVSKTRDDINLAQAIEADFTHFDLILDLGIPPLLNWEMPPLGYYAPRGDAASLERMLAELPDMVGEFDKAKFFHYNPAICAHGNSGLQGCRRCLDVCPTGAITSLIDKIAVDPYLCQGGGSCATACPSGAIIYSFPKPADTLNRLRVLLRTYREAGGSHPVLLVHDSEAGKSRLARLGDPLPGQVIPIEVEEVGSIGMEVWLAALAYGASRLLILTTPQVPPSVLQEIKEQMGFAHVLLEGMGYPASALRLSGSGTGQDLLADLTEGAFMPPVNPASFAGGNAKRDTLFTAIDFLAAQALSLNIVLALPRQAPFGEIQVKRDACTLCMACVSVCPGAALFDGGDAPRLEFLEANCVQCGLCELACPEDAIARRSRFLFDPRQRRRRRVLHEEEAFHCIACGQPFATRSMIEKLTARLNGHWMFQDDAALKRLQMCGECRVRNMFGSDGGMLT